VLALLGDAESGAASGAVKAYQPAAGPKALPEPLALLPLGKICPEGADEAAPTSGDCSLSSSAR
jgi:hypothetical protein